MPPQRWNPADERHLGGAFRDNRVVPYEGIRAGEFSAAQRERLLRLIESFIVYLPDAPRRARLGQIEQHFAET